MGALNATGGEDEVDKEKEDGPEEGERVHVSGWLISLT